MKQILSILILLCCSMTKANAQWNAPYFPTGMSWQECVLSLDSGEPQWGKVQTFEIGKDTVLNEQTYKQVWCDGKLEPICVREQDGIVWLLTELSPQELKLYDFNWDNQVEIATDYFQISEESYQLCTTFFNTIDIVTTMLNGTEIQYYRQSFSRTTIRGIGDVIDLTRFGCINHRHDCLLGFCKPEVVVPGLCFKKVINIQRSGIEIYHSDAGDDWINVIPSWIYIPSEASTNHQSPASWHTLSGRRLTMPPTRPGLYIKDGRKVVVK